VILAAHFNNKIRMATGSNMGSPHGVKDVLNKDILESIQELRRIVILSLMLLQEQFNAKIQELTVNYLWYCKCLE
jgi:hypothetical protein